MNAIHVYSIIQVFCLYVYCTLIEKSTFLECTIWFTICFVGAGVEYVVEHCWREDFSLFRTVLLLYLLSPN